MTSINKPAAQWTDEELLAWSRGEASPSGQASNRTVAKECVARFGFDATDDIDTIKALVIAKFVVAADEKELADEAPSDEPAPEGGDNADEANDDVEELESADDQTPPVNEVPSPVAEAPTAPVAPTPAPAPVVEPESTGEPEMPDENVLVKPTPVVYKQADMSREIIENNLASYAKAMAPNAPTSVTEGATKQLLLFRTFQVVLRTTGTDFFKNMDLLLGFIAANRTTLFTEARAFRHMNVVRLPANERKNFERLLNLFIGTAARDTRGMALRQVDLTRTVEGLDAETQQRLVEYYSV